MTKAVTESQSAKALTTTQAIKEIDKIVKECKPLADSKEVGFAAALSLASGVGGLRDIFLNNADIKKTIENMQDTPLGFLTDRSPAAIEAAKGRNKKLTPYSYAEVAECCIEAMLTGYRINGNEFNIIAGRFYPAKNGKYRKIVETPHLSDFTFTTTPPLYEVENRMEYGTPKAVQFAKVQCFAAWKIKRTQFYLGKAAADGGSEDKTIFKIKVNNMMGDDAIVGKALSKLFTRVLQRITGVIVPESTDLAEGEIIDLDTSGDDAGAADNLTKQITAGSDQKSAKKEQKSKITGNYRVNDGFSDEPPPDTEPEDEPGNSTLGKKSAQDATGAIKILTDLYNNGDEILLALMQETGHMNVPTGLQAINLYDKYQKMSQ